MICHKGKILRKRKGEYIIPKILDYEKMKTIKKGNNPLSLKEPSIETLILEHIEKGRNLEDRVFQKPVLYGNDDFKGLVSSWEEDLKSFEKKIQRPFYYGSK